MEHLTKKEIKKTYETVTKNRKLRLKCFSRVLKRRKVKKKTTIV